MNFGSKEELQAFRKYIISLLVKQAQSDGHFSLAEKKYLKFASDSMELTDQDVAVIRLNPDAFLISPPPDEVKRVNILYYMLFMMRADQKISPEEEALCHKVGLRLGFRADMVSDLISVMKDYLGQEMPPEAMVQKIRPFLN